MVCGVSSVHVCAAAFCRMRMQEDIARGGFLSRETDQTYLLTYMLPLRPRGWVVGVVGVATYVTKAVLHSSLRNNHQHPIPALGRSTRMYSTSHYLAVQSITSNR